MSDEREKSFDIFELITAILLGLGAVGGAFAGYQADLWGGQSVEAYGEAGTMSTRASTIFNRDLSQVIRDLNLDVEAKKQVFEAIYTEDDAVQERTYDVARWIFTTQISDDAYEALGLPPEPRTHALTQRAELEAELDRQQAEDARRAAQAPAPAPTPAAPTEGGEEGGAQPTAQPEQPAQQAEEDDDDGPQITPQQLASTFFRDLSEDPEYLTGMLAEGEQMFAAADRKFGEGRRANEVGDEFAYVGVLYTVALFLAGIALVFRSKVRWAFVGMGAVAVVVSTIYLASLERAGGGGGGGAPAPTSVSGVEEGDGEEADGGAAAATGDGG
ncbi:MAG: hypothetical protein IT379_31740 [Deltaproteobacteria bacterium]|nr:hypothetical protein [Deltaproteobacteria bacterium]